MEKADALKWSDVEYYLISIGMNPEVDTQQVQKLFNQAKVLCPEDLKDIFVSNYKESDGKDQFKDLWIFSDHYITEIMNFSRQEHPSFDMTIIVKNIQSFSIQADNFDFSEEATSVSKMHMKFYTHSGFVCDHIASGVNCKRLMSIFNTYIKDNLVVIPEIV